MIPDISKHKLWVEIYRITGHAEHLCESIFFSVCRVMKASVELFGEDLFLLGGEFEILTCWAFGRASRASGGDIRCDGRLN